MFIHTYVIITVSLLLISYCRSIHAGSIEPEQPPQYVRDISHCSNNYNSPVRGRPTSIHDLHPGDIKAIAVIGDSISAGLAMENAQTECITNASFIEYRGRSFDAGGDEGSITLPNFINHYTSGKLIGSSIGQRPMPTCPDTFFCTEAPPLPSVDHFNAAIPSGTTKDMTKQINYLIPRIGKTSPLSNEWKVLTIELGQNDLAISCFPDYNVVDFTARMTAGLKMIQENIDYVFINLLSVSNSEEEVTITNDYPGYRKTFCDNPSFDIHDQECYCCHVPLGLGDTVIDANVALFNLALQEIAVKFRPRGPDATFGVLYQPFSLSIDSLPYTAISNLDGFHPNIHLHQFFAKSLWNQMFLPKHEKEHKLHYDENLGIRCPGEDDRFETG
ncbi:hypothetical protein BDA99DRAFT_555045 [Phascolomyces articulosus]|uniref:Uncharacterized protein n=1 Tax=Phascolomyces articulosus TaxID=60185 RepID=A0AAD5PJC2_9FUNG|nr:hypothetical protein BDA99DRAFT_555045 [Phascolomyces articulosus]